MKSYKIVTSSLVLVLLLTLSVGMVDAQEGVGGEEMTAPQGGPPINDTFTYQGSLVVNGVPANGLYDFQASIYDWSSGGTEIAECDTALLGNITVTKGVFSFVCSPINFATGYNLDSVFNGQTRYLEVAVGPDGGGTLAVLPRQSITPVPYAWSLRPGAYITGTSTAGSIFAADAGLDGSSFGGAFGANFAFFGAGVYGHADYPSIAAMMAFDYNTTGTSWGLYASSASDTGYGVYAENTATNGINYGIYGKSQSLEGYAGYFVNTSNDPGAIDGPTTLYASRPYALGVAIEGEVTGTSGSGVLGDSLPGIGLYGNTSAAGGNYGVYTPDNLWASNYHKLGATMQLVQNGGSQPLQPGDVAIFVGIGGALEEGGQPVIQVARADAANSTAVAGVVYSRYNADALFLEPELAGSLPTIMEGAAQPGEYLLVVVQGPAQVNASALGGAIQVGDLLSSSTQPGLAGTAALVTIDGVSFTPEGTVFAKALEALDSGDGLIYVYVTLE